MRTIARGGSPRVICGIGSPARSAAGADIEVASMGTPALELVAVPRVQPPRSDAGFVLRPMVLPLTVLAVDPDGPAFAAGRPATIGSSRSTANRSRG